jgi:type I restriction enzyme, S subunit
MMSRGDRDEFSKGEGMSEWREVELDSVALINPTESLKMGDFAKKIAMDNLQPFTKKPSSYSLEKFNGGMKFRNGDTIVARITPCLENGKTAYIDLLDKNEVAFGSTEYIVLRERNGVSHSQFLYYFTISPIFRDVAILSMTGSSGRQRVQTDVVKHHLFDIPPLPEQKAIAAILSSLDDKIDLLHRQNKTLEAIAETLFRQWFIEEAQVDWEEGTIADLIDFNPSRKLTKGSVVPYLEMSALSNSTFNPIGWYDRTFASGTKFINGDTLLARITPCLENGKTAYITFLKKGQVAWGSTEYIVMRPKSEIHPFFAYVLARNSDFRDYAEGCLEGSSGRQRVNVDHLKNYTIKIPSSSVMNEFNLFAESTVPKLMENARQIRTLEKLRDTLLPKLMSGEVRVKV